MTLNDYSVIDLSTWKKKLVFAFQDVMAIVSPKLIEETLNKYKELNDACYELVEEHMKSRVPDDPRDLIDRLLDSRGN